MFPSGPKLRIHSEPLPRSQELILQRFKQAIQLSGVEEIRITPKEFVVHRRMEDEGPVFSDEPPDMEADAEFLLTKISENLVELPKTDASHPYVDLAEATSQINRQRLHVCAILAPRNLADVFGLEPGSEPDTFCGMKVIYHDLEEKYPDKLVLLGGPTRYISDATCGVIVDTGI